MMIWGESLFLPVSRYSLKESKEHFISVYSDRKLSNSKKVSEVKDEN